MPASPLLTAPPYGRRRHRRASARFDRLAGAVSASHAAVLVALVAVGSATPARLRGQDAQDASARAAACRAAIPDSALRPATVGLAMSLGASRTGEPEGLGAMLAAVAQAPVVSPTAQRVAEWTATEIRALVGSPEGTTAVDGLLAWHALDGVHAAFTLNAGRLTWRVAGGRAGIPAPRDSAGLQLLAQALDAVRDSLTALALPADSVDAPPSFTLAFDLTSPADPTRTAVGATVIRPLFRLGVPTLTPAHPVGALLGRYPQAARAQQYEAEVRATFVIGENGQVDPRTLRVVRASATPRAPAPSPRTAPATPGGRASFDVPPALSPHEARALFVQVTTDAIRRARYEPARVGHCPTRQLVEVPFRFEVRP